jgi:hypothetical protein
LFQRDNSDKILTATAQAPNPNPISIWQISLLKDLTANYSIHWYNDPDDAHPIQQAAQHSIVVSTDSLIMA